MVAVLLLLLAASTPASTSDFANRIHSIEQRTGARIGVAARDTRSDKRLDYRSEERFPMCSTFKLLAAAAVLKRVDEGKEKLDRFIAYVYCWAMCCPNLRDVSWKIGCSKARPAHS